ncbi:MAG: hypothetical protein ACR2P2_14585 [Nakamurella sp.]
MTGSTFWSAAGIAAVVSLLVSWLTSYLRRPKCVWVAHGPEVWPTEHPEFEPSPETFVGFLENAGDGTAHQVTATGTGCQVMMGQLFENHMGRPWRFVHTHAVLPPASMLRVQVTPEQADWQVTLRWRTPPIRMSWHHQQRFGQEDFPPRPTDLPQA